MVKLIAIAVLSLFAGKSNVASEVGASWHCWGKGSGTGPGDAEEEECPESECWV
jgi:hypothetical protein